MRWLLALGLMWASPVWAATVASWSFDADGHAAGEVADTLVDGVGVATGTVVTGGPIYSADVPEFATGLSLAFGGSDAINFADEPTFDLGLADTFTLELFIKTSASAGHHNLLVKLLPAAPFTGLQWILDAGTGQLQIAMQNNNAPHLSISVRSTTPINDGAWHHVAVTYDGSGTAAGFGFFIDYVADATTPVVDTVAGNSVLNDQPLRMGRDPRDINGLVGLLDEVRVHDTVLTPPQFVSFSPPPTGVPVPALPTWWVALLAAMLGLLGWWHLDEPQPSRGSRP